jgi:hypothetical protein
MAIHRSYRISPSVAIFCRIGWSILYAIYALCANSMACDNKFSMVRIAFKLKPLPYIIGCKHTAACMLKNLYVNT